ncbi:EVI2A protein, partial [Rhinopomastus cyanomelas]|nr:EVI2A protein [Rhinopomastus cyanomelas]
PHLAFPVAMIFSLCLQTRANRTDYPGVRNDTCNPTSPNLRGSWSAPAAATNSPPSTKATTFGTQTGTLPSSSSPAAQNSTLSPARSAVSAPAGPRNASKPWSTATKETCEDSKPLLLVCFVIIVVLVLICTSLFLATVLMASKMSSLRKAQQGKRRPRSNADILATNSLWPSAAGTWQRLPKDTAGTDLTLQTLGSGRGIVTRRKSSDECSEQLTAATENEEESKAPKPRKPTLTNFVVEV